MVFAKIIQAHREMRERKNARRNRVLSSTLFLPMFHADGIVVRATVIRIFSSLEKAKSVVFIGG